MKIRYLLVVLGVLAGCVPVPTGSLPANHAIAAVKAPPGFPERIAILPSNDQAGDADGAVLLRYILVRELGRAPGYTIQRLQDTDTIIQERIVGQDLPLPVFITRQDPATLASWLGVDGIFYSQLLQYSTARISLYSRSAVKAHLWLVNASGKKVWEATPQSDESGVGGGSFALPGDISDGSMPPDVLEKARHSDLAVPLLEQVDDAFSTFPRRS